MKKKTIQITVELETGNTSNYDICEFIQQILESSVLTSSVYHGQVVECKVTEERDIV